MIGRDAQKGLPHVHRVVVSVVITLFLTRSRTSVGANVVFDGSVGRHASAALSLTGHRLDIPADQGQMRGLDLFQSFRTFDLTSRQTAIFEGKADVKNIIARVTGGEPSSINGTIASDIPGANLYFMNPSGVIFGEKSHLNISGSFVVTTANSLTLPDGARFDATVNSKATPGNHAAPLLSVSPETYRFSTSTPAPITFEGDRPNGVSNDSSGLSVPAMRAITVVGGDIQIRSFRLAAKGGQIALVSRASTGTVVVNSNSIAGNIQQTGGAQGTIRMKENVKIDVDGTNMPAGRIVIRGAQLLMRGMHTLLHPIANDPNPQGLRRIELTAQSSNVGTGGGIDIQLTQSMKYTGNVGIVAGTQGLANGGNVNISAPFISMHGEGMSAGSITEEYGIASASLLPKDKLGGDPYGTIADGAGGDIHIKADQLEIADNAKISGETYGQGGRGGNIFLDVGTLKIDGTNTAPGDFTGIISQTKNFFAPLSAPLKDQDLFLGYNVGNAGDIQIRADAVELRNSGRINAETLGPGAAGNIDIECRGPVTIVSDTLLSKPTGIRADTERPAQVIELPPGDTAMTPDVHAGNGGQITIRSKRTCDFIAPGNTIRSGGRRGIENQWRTRLNQHRCQYCKPSRANRGDQFRLHQPDRWKRYAATHQLRYIPLAGGKRPHLLQRRHVDQPGRGGQCRFAEQRSGNNFHFHQPHAFPQQWSH